MKIIGLHKIREHFRRSCRGPFSALVLGFAAAGQLTGANAKAEDAPPPAPIQQPQATNAPAVIPGHTFWKHPDYDAIIEIWTDPVLGLRGKVASLNPDNPKIRSLAAKAYHMEDEKKLTRDQVLAFQGLEGDLHLHSAGDGKWTGTIYWPYTRFKVKTFGVDVDQRNDQLHVHGYLLPWKILGVPMPQFGKSTDLKPSAPPSRIAAADTASPPKL
jgi:hypothetical protein